MTCVVGLVDHDRSRVWLGADSAGVAGWDLTVRSDPKIFVLAAAAENEPPARFALGFTDSFRMGQLLGCALHPPRPRPDEDLFAYMVGPFVNAVRRTLKEGGFATVEEGREGGGRFLVAVAVPDGAPALFFVGGDYQVGAAADGYAAVGCGAPIALGALHATRAIGDPRERVALALAAAERHSAGVRRPFLVTSVDGQGDARPLRALGDGAAA